LLRRGRGVERRALAAADISIQGELRNHEHAAAHVLRAAVHLAVLVFEEAEARNLLGQISCVGLGVFVSHAQQNQQSQADLTAGPVVSGLIIDSDFGAAHALHDGPHRTSFASQ